MDRSSSEYVTASMKHDKEREVSPIENLLFLFTQMCYILPSIAKHNTLCFAGCAAAAKATMWLWQRAYKRSA